MTLTQIYNTQDYIEAHYNELIAVSTLEKISCYSYRNLQRVVRLWGDNGSLSNTSRRFGEAHLSV